MLQISVLFFLLTIQNVISKTDEFICPKDGRWPHPSDCEKYYTCNTGISIEGWCGTGMSYDPNHQRCDLTKNIECQNGERASWTPPEGWLQSESATNYVVTKTTEGHDDDDGNDNSEIKKKTRGPKKHKVVTTTTRGTTLARKLSRNRVTLPISQLVENTDCTFQGNMPDPDNCQSYYTCKDDVITRIHCPERQLFDEDLRICTDYRKVFCANRPVNERANDPCIAQQNGWYADPEYQCRVYYLCTEQRKTKMGECPLGSKWNSQRLRCDDPRNILTPCGLRSNNGFSFYDPILSLILIMIFSLFTLQ